MTVTKVSLPPRTTGFIVPGTAAHRVGSETGSTVLAVDNPQVIRGSPEPSSTSFILSNDYRPIPDKLVKYEEI